MICCWNEKNKLIKHLTENYIVFIILGGKIKKITENIPCKKVG